jgi:hypothetical protein
MYDAKHGREFLSAIFQARASPGLEHRRYHRLILIVIIDFWLLAKSPFNSPLAGVAVSNLSYLGGYQRRSVQIDHTVSSAVSAFDPILSSCSPNPLSTVGCPFHQHIILGVKTSEKSRFNTRNLTDLKIAQI